MGSPLFRTLLLVLLGIAGAKGALAADVSPLQEIVNEKLALVAGWESEARFLVMLGLAGIVLGSLITLLQPWASRLWCKVTAGAFGVAAAVVAFLIGHSAVSATSYQNAALQARAQISGLSDDLNFLKATSDPDIQKALQDEFTKTVKAINQIQLKLSGEDKTTSTLWRPITVVYAQSEYKSKTPSWVTKLPVSTTDLYFRGEAQSRSLAEAKANSLNDAIAQCARYFQSIGKSLPDDAAKQYAQTSTTSAQTTFTFDAKSQLFHYYTLLRLDKTLARPAVINSLAGSQKH